MQTSIFHFIITYFGIPVKYPFKMLNIQGKGGIKQRGCTHDGCTPAATLFFRRNGLTGPLNCLADQVAAVSGTYLSEPLIACDITNAQFIRQLVFKRLRHNRVTLFSWHDLNPFKF
jgi:hypothetical protein